MNLTFSDIIANPQVLSEISPKDRRKAVRTMIEYMETVGQSILKVLGIPLKSITENLGRNTRIAEPIVPLLKYFAKHNDPDAVIIIFEALPTRMRAKLYLSVRHDESVMDAMRTTTNILLDQEIHRARAAAIGQVDM